MGEWGRGEKWQEDAAEVRSEIMPCKGCKSTISRFEGSEVFLWYFVIDEVLLVAKASGLEVIIFSHTNIAFGEEKLA